MPRKTKPLLAGRDFTDHDRVGSAPVAVVNEQFARQYLVRRGNLAEALGRSIRLRDSGAIQIVGVVKGSKEWDVS